MPTTDQLSNNIYLSRDRIRTHIIDYMKTYLELENIDLTKSSFLSFMCNTFSTLTSNLLFYQASSYREFFMTKAQLPETIFDLSAFLGYNIREAKFATVEVLITVPLKFTDSLVEFRIPNGSDPTRSGGRFYADTVQFVTFYHTNVKVINNTTAEITMIDDNDRVYENIPVEYDEGDSFKFLLPLRQLKTIVQEFQISETLQTYQFTSLEVPLTGQISSIDIEIRTPNNSSWNLFSVFDSIYLMAPTDLGYVIRSTDTGRKIYFGNGLIGVQPQPGSTVKTTILETLGSEGNVIAGSIKNGERIYTTSPGAAKSVTYSVTNPTTAVGGTDEENTEEIRRNAIASLTSLNRLVSESDYANTNVVIPSTPIRTGSLPVLKRSDLNVNEIQLYISLAFNDKIVPTRNLFETYSVDTITLPRGTIIEYENEDFILLFDIEIDHELNKKAYYYYIMDKLKISPSQVKTFIPEDDDGEDVYNISLDEVSINRVSDNEITIEISYSSSEDDLEKVSCQMKIFEKGITFGMHNNVVDKKFELKLDISTYIGKLTYLFNLSHTEKNELKQYSITFIAKQSLEYFMQSNISTDGTNTTVYDIPVVLASFYNGLSAEDTALFELVVLQSLVSTMEFSGYKMLTDFVNLKFTNTYGLMTKMQLNETPIVAVTDIKQIEVPSVLGLLGARYIVNGYEIDPSEAWKDKKNKIAQCYGYDGSTPLWSFTSPYTDNIIYVANQDKKYIYTDAGWVIPVYQTPMRIVLDVFKLETATSSDLEMENTIKEELLKKFSSRFGSNISIYRSEIIDVVQSVDGVKHCRLLEPLSSIFFKFDLKKLTQQQLLEYSPDYVYFTEDDIIVRTV